MTTWYKKCMPQIKDIKPHLADVVKEIKEIDGIESVYVWGSYSTNLHKDSYRVKDIDILVKTAFNSGDLISIDDNIIKNICTDSYLESQGYDPMAIKFSKRFTNFTKYNIDHWAISSDNKLLHWGAINVNKDESDDINKEAEQYAFKQTGYNLSKINKSSESTRKNWYRYYCNYINRFFSDMPSGWYQSSEKNMNYILKEAKKL